MTRGGFGASSDGDPIFGGNFFRLSFKIPRFCFGG